MAESKKNDSTSGNLREKDSFLDIDIGKDFLSSWKSISMADGNGMDFDLPPISKGNKNSFSFDKADIDFNLDGNFGKMASFNLDMSDLDVSPPLKRDGKSKENFKETSKRKEKGKSDCFAFAFDFDEFEKFDLDSSLTKEGSKAQKDKDNKGSSPGAGSDQDKEGLKHMNLTGKMNKLEDGPQKRSLAEPKFNFDLDCLVESRKDVENPKNNLPSKLADDTVTSVISDASESSPGVCSGQDKEDSMHMNLNGKINISEDGPQKQSLPETELNSELDCLDGTRKDVENTKKNVHSNLVDDAVTSVSSDAKEVASDKRGPIPPVIASRELPKAKHVSLDPVNLDSCDGNDAKNVFSSENVSNSKLSNTLVSQEKVDCEGSNATDSNIEQDVHMPSIAGSTCNKECIMPENLQQPIANMEKSCCEKSEIVANDHGMDIRERTERGKINSLSEKHSENLEKGGVVVNDHAVHLREGIETDQVSSLVEKHCPEVSRSQMLCNTSSAIENQKTASENIKFPHVSQPGDLPDKRMNRREPHFTSLKSSIPSKKLEYSVQKAASQKTILSLSSEKMGFTKSSIATGRELDFIQGMKSLASSSMQHNNSETLLKRDIPQTQRKESSKGLHVFGTIIDGRLQAGKLPSSATTLNKDMVKTRSPLWQRETSTKDPDTLSSSMEIINKAAQGIRSPTTLSSMPTKSCTPEVQKLSSTENGKDTPDLCVLKQSDLDSAKSPITNNLKSGASISQDRILLKKTPSVVARSPEMQKQAPCCSSIKRKSFKKDSIDDIALHPSKRLSHSLTLSRDSVQIPKTVHNQKEPGRQNKEDAYIKYATENCQTSTYHNSQERHIKEVENSFSVSNIELAEAYSKELDNLCNILRKKNNEAKELLAQALVNTNKMLLLDNPVFEEKNMRATQKLLSTLTLNSIQG